ncbi:MAG: hypothetical protein AAF602_25125, partial [Myxococcota bacterium]
MLAPRVRADPGHPADWPIGRAALALEAEGIAVVIGDRAEGGVLSGVRARDAGWVDVALPVNGVYDRFPSRSRAEEHAQLRAALVGVRWVNDPRIVALCADKVACQAWIAEHVPMPEVEADPERFAARLAAWGSGFAKPRYGAFGAGIERVTTGSTIDGVRETSVPGEVEPTILQRAVEAPAGFAGIALRVLVQRTADDAFVADPAVVRFSLDDPVVNAARGATVTDAAGCAEVDEPRAQALAVAAAERLAAAPGGADLV